LILFLIYFSFRAITIAILGLDNAGKLNTLKNKRKFDIFFLKIFLGKTTTTRVLEKGNKIFYQYLIILIN